MAVLYRNDLPLQLLREFVKSRSCPENYFPIENIMQINPSDNIQIKELRIKYGIPTYAWQHKILELVLKAYSLRLSYFDDGLEKDPDFGVYLPFIQNALMFHNNPLASNKDPFIVACVRHYRDTIRQEKAREIEIQKNLQPIHTDKRKRAMDDDRTFNREWATPQGSTLERLKRKILQQNRSARDNLIKLMQNPAIAKTNQTPIQLPISNPISQPTSASVDAVNYLQRLIPPSTVQQQRQQNSFYSNLFRPLSTINPHNAASNLEASTSSGQHPQPRPEPEELPQDICTSILTTASSICTTTALPTFNSTFTPPIILSRKNIAAKKKRRLGMSTSSNPKKSIKNSSKNKRKSRQNEGKTTHKKKFIEKLIKDRALNKVNEEATYFGKGGLRAPPFLEERLRKRVRSAASDTSLPSTFNQNTSENNQIPEPTSVLTETEGTTVELLLINSQPPVTEESDSTDISIGSAVPTLESSDTESVLETTNHATPTTVDVFSGRFITHLPTSNIIHEDYFSSPILLTQQFNLPLFINPFPTPVLPVTARHIQVSELNCNSNRELPPAIEIPATVVPNTILIPPTQSDENMSSNVQNISSTADQFPPTASEKEIPKEKKKIVKRKHKRQEPRVRRNRYRRTHQPTGAPRIPVDSSMPSRGLRRPLSRGPDSATFAYDKIVLDYQKSYRMDSKKCCIEANGRSAGVWERYFWSEVWTGWQEKMNSSEYEILSHLGGYDNVGVISGLKDFNFANARKLAIQVNQSPKSKVICFFSLWTGFGCYNHSLLCLVDKTENTAFFLDPLKWKDGSGVRGKHIRGFLKDLKKGIRVKISYSTQVNSLDCFIRSIQECANLLDGENYKSFIYEEIPEREWNK